MKYPSLAPLSSLTPFTSRLSLLGVYWWRCREGKEGPSLGKEGQGKKKHMLYFYFQSINAIEKGKREKTRTNTPKACVSGALFLLPFDH